MAKPVTLYHYTCDHGHRALRSSGMVLPSIRHSPRAFDGMATPQVLALASLSWFTDLTPPEPWALGLTSESITCDRTRYRWRVTTTERPPIRWGRIRSTMPKVTLDALELVTAGAQPARWWVASWPVPVTFDPA